MNGEATKFEARNPKFETIANDQISKQLIGKFRSFENWDLEFVSPACAKPLRRRQGFRYSNFEFESNGPMTAQEDLSESDRD
ncbi:MAG: hypothetical protein A2026_06635 [Deltaproteobacteria bacterium RBG_19FT_COMBO_46_12]|nr:MAG: hypothetical protein A2026_06635 [Deltaproteobacteria bacterium RBG_19FT_COMBO_46_12]